MTELTEKKTPEQLGAEIRMYVDAGRRISLLCGIEIGKRLTQAKEMLDHGEWLPWLERETEFSSSSAQRYMKLFEEYGASQLGLFGPETNSPTLGNLPISKAFALLSVPESEREDFAEKVDAEHISVRELEQAIREKEAAERRAECTEKLLQETRQNLIEEEKAHEQTIFDKEEMEEELIKTKERIAELARLNKELEERPVEVAVQTVVDEKAVQEASRKAAEEASKEYEKKVADLQKKLSAAEKERDQAKTEAEASGSAAKKLQAESERAAQQLRTELEEAKKKLKTSDADVTAFGIRFNTIQSEWSYLVAELEKVRQRDPEKAGKLQEAVRQMLELFRKEVEKDV